MNLATITIFYFILQSNSTHSPEFTGLINFLFICLFIFCWIHADSDPQHRKLGMKKFLHILTNILLKTTRYFNSKSYGVSFKSRAKAKFKGIHPKTSALGGPTPSVSDPDPHESPLWATSWIRIQEVNKASSWSDDWAPYLNGWKLEPNF